MADPVNGAAPKAPALSMAHLYTALTTTKSSISEADEQRYNTLFAPYRPGVRPNALRRDGSEVTAGTKVALA